METREIKYRPGVMFAELAFTLMWVVGLGTLSSLAYAGAQGFWPLGLVSLLFGMSFLFAVLRALVVISRMHRLRKFRSV